MQMPDSPTHVQQLKQVFSSRDAYVLLLPPSGLHNCQDNAISVQY